MSVKFEGRAAMNSRTVVLVGLLLFVLAIAFAYSLIKPATEKYSSVDPLPYHSNVPTPRTKIDPFEREAELARLREGDDEPLSEDDQKVLDSFVAEFTDTLEVDAMLTTEEMDALLEDDLLSEGEKKLVQEMYLSD